MCKVAMALRQVLRLATMKKLCILSAMHRNLNRLVLPIALLVYGALPFAASPAFSKSNVAIDRAPSLQAVSAILMEAETGKVLFEYHPDEPIAPASLTKLMTLHIALEQIAQGRLDPEQVIQPVRQAWARNMPYGSSLMFLGPNQQLTVDQLLKGLVVASGNDAAYALAYQIAGSIPAFARMMNDEARRFGYRVMHFVEPSGISAQNRVTAREYADFCRHFIALHPDALRDLLSLREFTYPQPVNLINGNHEHPITQRNRNVLLWKYAGADGLKTGYIDESGYNMAVTAERDGMRLIAVVLGVRDEMHESGSRLRAQETEQLLDYGFAKFTKLTLGYPKPAPVLVWKGNARHVEIAPEQEPVLVLPKEEVTELKGVVEQQRDIVAPVKKGDSLGAVVYTVNGKEVGRFPLRATRAVEEGGFFRKVFDSVQLFFRDLFAGA